MQRIASYFAESLSERTLKSYPGLYKTLNFTKMSSVSDEFLAKKLFFDLFPFLKLAFSITNQSIIEAMKGEKMVHIINLNASESAQWIALIQELSDRSESPPHLRITGVHQHKEILEQVALRLTQEAEKFDLPFQFHSVVCKLQNLDIEKLRVKTGEALAISSALQLHTLLCSDYETETLTLTKPSNRRRPSNDSASSSPQSLNTVDSFLISLWGLSPKIMVIIEQDSNHNGSNLMDRLSESLYFYATLFDCLEFNLPRTSLERRKIEKLVLGEEIKNIIACEGGERRERHEKFEKWVQRFELARFGSVPLSYIGMVKARELLRRFGCDGYRIEEANGSVVICWQDRPLFSVSAWTCNSRR